MCEAYAYRESQYPQSWLPGLALSIFIHLLIAASLYSGFFSSSMPPGEPSRIFSVALIEPPQIISRAPERTSSQIVSPPENQLTDRPPQAKAFKSDQDRFVDRQQVRRGDGPDAGRQHGRAREQPPAPQQQAAQNKAAAGKPSEQAEAQPKPQGAKKLTHLKLDQDTFGEQFVKDSSEERTETLRAVIGGRSVAGSPSGRVSQPFSRPFGSGAAFVGMSGTNDYLPNLPDGDITLLNTKADMFAVFVRRVALQVFGQLRSVGWDNMSSSDVRAIAKDSTVRAVLSKQGALLRVTLEDASGSRRFDDVLLDAVKLGAKDPNPPNGAEATDGNIHFIFKARSWSRFASDPRSGAPMERRWLLLATGLD